MATEKRLIDANDALKRLKKAEQEMNVVSIVGCKAVPMDGVIEFLETRPTVDAVEVVHSRFVRIADFGDGEGCFGYCERCGTIHHAQHLVALKAGHRWCRWCGAKMDGDGNG